VSALQRQVKAQQDQLAALLQQRDAYEFALRFYADPYRHQGGNHLRDAFDPYTKHDAPYRQDVGRDGGDLALKVLGRVRVLKPAPVKTGHPVTDWELLWSADYVPEEGHWVANDGRRRGHADLCILLREAATSGNRRVEILDRRRTSFGQVGSVAGPLDEFAGERA
jgi:hypothetical protein